MGRKESDLIFPAILARNKYTMCINLFIEEIPYSQQESRRDIEAPAG
tara:strand:+ start:2011 stop:2151 length:141 start_codon:yes stop_codon:yes gene_type:complete